jgi:serine/threonine-protein kinase
VTKLFEQPSENYEEEETLDNTSTVLLGTPGNAAAAALQEAPQQPVYHQEQPQNVIHERSAPVYKKPRRDDSYKYDKETTVDRIKVPIIVALLFLAIMMILGVIIYKLIVPPAEETTVKSSRRSSSVSDSAAENTTKEADKDKDTEVPDLVGQFYTYSKDKWKVFFVLDADFEYNNDYDNDMIFEQSVKKGEMIAQGDVIKVKVSKGKETATIPDYQGLTMEQYKNALDKAGIHDHNYQFVESKDSYGKANSIVGLQVDGKTVTPNSTFNNKSGKKLTVYYVSANTVTAAPTTAAPATTEAAATTVAVTTQAPQPTTQAPTAPPEPVTNPPEPVTNPPEPPVEQPAEQPAEGNGE